jgi:hypothetical protein
LLAATPPTASAEAPTDQLAWPGTVLPNEFPAAAYLDLATHVFGDYVSRFPEGQDHFGEFRLMRGEAGFMLGYGPWVRSELRLEAIRSAGPQSLFGVDQNSMVFRAKRAWAGFGLNTSGFRVELQGGLVFDPWIEAVQSGYDFRGVAALASERGTFFDAADLGAKLMFSGWGGLLEVALSFANGEGRNQIEQNRGKNITGVITVRPWMPTLFGQPAALGIVLSAREGSLGTGSVRNHRYSGAITFRSTRVGGGLEYVYADGYLGRSSRSADGLGVWAGGTILDGWLGIFGRYDRMNLDYGLDDATNTRITAGLYTDPLTALTGGSMPGAARLYVLYERETFGEDAGAVAGAPLVSEEHRLMFRLDINLGFRVWRQ